MAHAAFGTGGDLPPGYKLVKGEGSRLVKIDRRTPAQKEREAFWERRRAETGDGRAGLGVFGDAWNQYWSNPLIELTNTKTGELTHVRLMRYWPDDGVADLAVVAVMAGGATSGVGLQAKVPWPPGPNIKARVIADSRR